MRMVSVDKERLYNVMERCGAYVGEVETGHTHNKALWCRNLSRWHGETVVGVESHGIYFDSTYEIAGYLDDYYK